MLRLGAKLAKEGYKIYQEKLKNILEPRHLGEYVAIEVDSGEYFLGADLAEALERAEKKYPEREFFVIKVGELATASFKHRFSLRKPIL